MDTGLLIIRVVVGLIVAAHGVQKLFGWLDGPGINSTASDFARLGYRPAMALAVLSGIAEAAGGLLLALGLLVPLASAAIIGSMLSALLAVHLKSGFWAYDRGYEYMIVLAGVSAGLAFAGGGAWSLDALLGLGSLSGPIWGSAAVIVGLVTALPLELYRRRVVAADQRAEEVSPPTRRAA